MTAHLWDFVPLDALGLWFMPNLNPFNPHPFVFIGETFLPQVRQCDTEVITVVAFIDRRHAAEVGSASCLLERDHDGWGGLHCVPPFLISIFPHVSVGRFERK